MLTFNLSVPLLTSTYIFEEVLYVLKLRNSLRNNKAIIIVLIKDTICDNDFNYYIYYYLHIAPEYVG